MKKPVNFETDRLVLRPTGVEDAAFVLELLNTPKWIRYIGDRNVKTLDAAREYIESKVIPQQERLGFSNYTLIRKSDGSKIGTCGLYDREGLEGIDLGFAFLPDYERQGYAYESASKILELAHSEFGIEEVSAITDKENAASQKLLAKLGMKNIGTTKLPGSEEELLLFRTS